MNNAEKSTYVKTQITYALLKLLKTKDLKDISVSEITSVAEVSRVSFYRNFSEKEDVIREHMKRLLGSWMSENIKNRDSTEDERLGNIFAHLTEHREFYQLLSRRNLFYLLKDIILGVYGPKPEYKNFDAYTTAFISNGIYGWIEEWFSRGMKESGEEMTTLLKGRNLDA